MAKWKITVDVDSRGSKADIEYGIREILDEHAYQPGPVTAEPRPGEIGLRDLNPALVRRSTGPEDYRIVIPGLVKDGKEVTVPMYEEDVDPELLAHILDHEGSWE